MSNDENFSRDDIIDHLRTQGCPMSLAAIDRIERFERQSTLCFLAFNKASTRVEELEDALKEIINPLMYMRIRAEQQGRILSNQAYSIANEIEYLRTIAKHALKKDDEPNKDH